MNFAVQPESPPIREEADGALRVGNSRVLLELVIRAFQAVARISRTAPTLRAVVRSLR